ncbi:hypothetical protein LCGC14_2004990 [marine sediment metagenome]|uniref:Uncharacterized protein n=1 Tax=marine sediment metagenome TaxID=412755 RepID=A0A0F9HZ38_9ZZZZ
MITCTIIVNLAFIWLLIETDLLRVQLLERETILSCQWRMPDNAVTPSMRLELYHLWNKGLTKISYALLSGGHTSPLCGWGYAYQYRDFKPEYKVELNTGGVRYNMTIKQPSIIKDIMRANRLTKAQKQAYA